MVLSSENFMQKKKNTGQSKQYGNQAIISSLSQTNLPLQIARGKETSHTMKTIDRSDLFIGSCLDREHGVILNALLYFKGSFNESKYNLNPKTLKFPMLRIRR